MTTASLSDEALLAFFHSHPNLRDRVISIVGMRKTILQHLRV